MIGTHLQEPRDGGTRHYSATARRGLRTALRVAGWTVLALAGLLLCALIILSLVDWNGFRGPIARFAGARLHREVRIDGPLHVRVFSRTPSVDVQGLHIGNPQWLHEGEFLSVKRVQAALLASQLLRLRLAFDRIEVDDPVLSLVQDRMNRANWQFSPAKKDDASGPHIPPIRQFTVRGGNLQLDDQMHSVRFTGRVAASQQGDDAAAPLHLQGNGEFNQSPFTVEFSGNPLVNIRIDAPYEFRATAAAGATHAALNGSIDRPFDLGRFSAGVEASGRNLADLYYLTGLALPRTPQYQVRFQLRRERTRYTARDIVGTIGQSDVHGTAGVDLRRARPFLTADVQSRSLRLRDLGVAFGADPNAGTAANGGTGPRSAQGPARAAALLLPDEPFEFTRLNQTDAHVTFRADSVQTAKLPLKAVSLDVTLRDGVLRLDPAVLTLPQGRLSGTAVLDTHPQPAAVSIDARLDDVQLEQFKKKGSADAPLKGVLKSHAVVEGRGDSLHAVASSGHGQLTAVLPQGEIREALAELTGINVLRGLGLLAGGQGRTAPIRCGVAQFTLDHGVAQSDRIVFDTENVTVEGKGRIEFADESLHLDFTGHPKSVRLLRLRSPINVRGTLAKPSMGIDAGSALKQGGAAAALSALTPIAAILAFVDRGVAKDQNCAALLAQANDEQRPSAPK